MVNHRAKFFEDKGIWPIFGWGSRCWPPQGFNSGIFGEIGTAQGSKHFSLLGDPSVFGGGGFLGVRDFQDFLGLRASHAGESINVQTFE
jgi:hypothetical protein